MGIADDIVVCGSTPSEHDQAFCEMLKATRKHNVSLNSEKLHFKQAQVDFYGHVLTENGIQPASPVTSVPHENNTWHWDYD